MGGEGLQARDTPAPEIYSPYMSLAKFHERRGEFEKALPYYQKALDRNPLNESSKRSVNRLQGAGSG